MQNFSYFHETFNLRKLSSYFLQILLSKTEICYAITDVVRNQHIAIKRKIFENPNDDILSNFQNAVREDVYLNKHYKTVNFYFASENNTLVPLDFFDKKNSKDFYNNNHTLNNGEEVQFNFIEHLQIYNLYSIPSILINFLVNLFPEVRLFHSTTSFLVYFVNYSKKISSQQKVIGINFNKSSFDIVVLKNQKISFYNSFNFKTDEDAIYFLLSVFKKLDLDSKRQEIYAQGEIEHGSKLYQYLLNFIPNTKFVTKFEWEFPFKQLSPHKHALILNNIE